MTKKIDSTFDIVVPTYGRSALLRRTLSALSEQALPAQLRCIHVVENGPKFGAELLCADYAELLPIRYHYLEAAGVNGARNLGAISSNSDFIVFYDDDVKPTPGAIQSYADAFSRLGNQCFFGGPLIADYDEPPPDWLIEFLPNSARGFSLGEHEVTVDGPVFIGSNFAVSKVLLDELGYFEGPCPTGATGGGLGDETRLLRRLLDGGYSGIYLPGAGVMHYVPRERCNAHFMRHRSWRHGYGNGQLLAREKSTQHRILLGVPAWYWSQMGSLLLALLRTVKPGFSKTDAFRQLLNVYQQAGSISGYRESRNLDRKSRTQKGFIF